MLAGATPSPFVGRDHELALLLAAVEESTAGRMLALVIGGDSGVGKTRLVAEAMKAMPEGATVLIGSAIDIAEKPSFWPVVDALRRFLRRPDASWATEILQPWEDQLGRSLTGSPRVGRSGAGPQDGPDSGSTSELLGVELLCQVLVALTAHSPVVLVVEDLQWSDRSTRDLLVYLLANVTDEPILLLTTYRRDAVHRDHPLRLLLPELRRHRRARFLDLLPLSQPALSELVRAGRSSRVDPDLEELVWDRSEGNPFLAEETLRAAGTGQLREVPQTLRELVLSRVDHLSAATRQVLSVIAVGQGPIEHQLLSSVAELPEKELLGALRAAVDASILAVDPGREGYRFAHGLLKDVLLTELLPGERMHLHRRYGEVLASGDSLRDSRTATLLSHHFDHAGDWPRALEATIAAAEHAERVHGWMEAFEHWTRALRLDSVIGGTGAGADTGTDSTRSSLLERAAESAHLAGEHQQAVALLRDRLKDESGVTGIEPAFLYQRLGVYLIAAGHSGDALAAHEQAVALLPRARAGPQHAVIVGSYAEALVLTGRYGAGRAEAQRALHLAEEAGGTSEQSQILAILGFSLACLEDSQAGVDALHEGRRIAELTNDPHDIGRSILHLAELLAGPLNELEEAVDVATGGVERVAELGLVRTYGVALYVIAANALFRLGRWDAAADRLQTALAAKPTGAQAIELHLARARLLVGRGEFDDAEEELEAIDVLSAEASGTRHRVPLLTLRAGLQMWLGRPEEALDVVLSGLEMVGTDSDDVWVLAPLVWHGLRAVADSVEARVNTRSSDARSASEVGAIVDTLLLRIEELDQQATEAPSAVATTVAGYRELCAGEVARARGTLDPDVWALAAHGWAARNHPYPAAYARFRQAEALFAGRAGAAGAASALRKAYSTASRLGARPFLTQIEALAQRARVVLAEDPSPGRDPANGPGSSLRTAGSDAAAAPVEGTGAVERTADDTHAPGVLDVLTKREQVVLAELAEGRSNREIGDRLFISEKTVSVHVSHILAKLDLRSRVQAGSLYHRLRSPLPSP